MGEKVRIKFIQSVWRFNIPRVLTVDEVDVIKGLEYIDQTAGEISWRDITSPTGTKETPNFGMNEEELRDLRDRKVRAFETETDPEKIVLVHKRK